MNSTGRNEKGLKEILDFTRLAAIVILLIHFYFYCYAAFKHWNLTAEIGNRFLQNFVRTGLFRSIFISKLIALGLLAISLAWNKRKKDERIQIRAIFFFLSLGLALYFLGHYLFRINGKAETVAVIYIAVTSSGFMLVLTGGTLLSRLISFSLNKHIFNETFPQEERMIENECSINIPTIYNLKGKRPSGWINIINPFRGTLVTGSPGSGKSYFVIQHVIRQHLRKGFSMLVYYFKYDDLSKIAYNTLLKTQSIDGIRHSFYLINFDDLS